MYKTSQECSETLKLAANIIEIFADSSLVDQHPEEHDNKNDGRTHVDEGVKAYIIASKRKGTTVVNADAPRSYNRMALIFGDWLG